MFQLALSSEYDEAVCQQLAETMPAKIRAVESLLREFRQGVLTQNEVKSAVHRLGDAIDYLEADIEKLEQCQSDGDLTPDQIEVLEKVKEALGNVKGELGLAIQMDDTGRGASVDWDAVSDTIQNLAAPAITILEAFGQMISCGRHNGPRHCISYILDGRAQTVDSSILTIAATPGRHSGRATMRGSRLAVFDVLSMFATGVNRQDVLADFPELEAEDIAACPEHTAAMAPGTREDWVEDYGCVRFGTRGLLDT